MFIVIQLPNNINGSGPSFMKEFETREEADEFILNNEFADLQFNNLLLVEQPCEKS
jgi:hypothetical protein